MPRSQRVKKNATVKRQICAAPPCHPSCTDLSFVWLRHNETNKLQEITANELVVESLAQASGGALDDDASTLESLDLGVGTALSARDNGTGVAHATARGSGDTGNEADNGLAVANSVGLLEELGCVLFSRSTNLTNHDDTVRLGVLSEDLKAVDEVGAVERVTANTNDERLAEAGLGGLVDSLVGEGSGTRDDTDATALVDETRHDTDLALAGSDDAGAVGADQTGFGLRLQHGSDANHV